MDKLKTTLLTLLLVSACFQRGIGANFSESGEQIGTAIPVTLVATAIIFCLFLFLRSRLPIPKISRSIAFFLFALTLGLLGFSQGALKDMIKESIQLGVIFFAAYWLFEASDDESPNFPLAFSIAGIFALILGTSGLNRTSFLMLSNARLSFMVIASTPFLVQLSAQNPDEKKRLVLLLGFSAATGIAFEHGWLLTVQIAVMFVSILLLDRPNFRKEAMIPFCTVAFSLLPFLHTNGTVWTNMGPHYDSDHLRRTAIEAEAAFKAPIKFPFGGGLGNYKKTINELKLYSEHEPHPMDMKVPKDGNNQYLLLMVEAGGLAAVSLLAVLLSAISSVRSQNKTIKAASLALWGVLPAGLFCVYIGRGTGVWFAALLALTFSQSCSISAAFRRWLVPVAGGAVMMTLFLVVNKAPVGAAEKSIVNALAAHALFGEASPWQPEVVELADPLITKNAGDMISLEAEDFLEKDTAMEIFTDPDASGQKALIIPDHTMKGKGVALYQFNLPGEPGEFIISARVS